MASAERFTLIPYFRFLLVIRFLGPIALIGIISVAVATPELELTTWGPIILLALVAWTIYEGIKLFKWFSFSITLYQDGLQVKENQIIPWDHIHHAWAQNAHHFETFIQLTTNEGEVIDIPAVIQNNQLLLNALKKRITNLEFKS